MDRGNGKEGPDKMRQERKKGYENKKRKKNHCKKETKE